MRISLRVGKTGLSGIHDLQRRYSGAWGGTVAAAAARETRAHRPDKDHSSNLS